MATSNPEPSRVASRALVERLRGLCLALPETSERSSWGHPNFRAGKKTFAAFEVIRGRPSIAFRLPAEEVEELVLRETFFETPYGRGLWASLWADGTIDWKLVDRLLRRSYRVVALKRMLTALEAQADSRRSGAASR